MKKVLSILLINLIFVFVYSQIVDNSDLPNELLNDREIQKYIKSFEKFKRYFRSLDDTSESNEDSEESSGEESNELSSGDESNDLSSGDESNELSSGEESNELSSGDESNELSSGEESNELSSGEESNELSSGEESTGSEETGTSTDTTTPTETIETEAPSGNITSTPTESPTEAQTETPTETPTQTPTETPTETPTQTPTETPTETPTQTPTQTPSLRPTPNSSTNSVKVVLFSGYHTTTNTNTNNYIRPLTIVFNLYIAYTGFTPALRISFTLRLIFSVFRGLQESNENSTTTNTTSDCLLESQDEETGMCRYNCEAETDKEPANVESLNDYKFDNQSLELGSNFTISDTALDTSKNLITANSTISKIKSLQNGVVFNNDTTTFSIRGQLKGIKEVNSIPFSFVDKSKGENDTKRVDVQCNVIKDDEEDFQIKCTPEADLETYINGTIGELDDETGVYLNMTEHQNYVNVHKSSNVIYRKNSSGLSGGAIAGIVIACAVILILVSLIIMCIRKPKSPENNNSSVVGLRTVDNFTE